MGRPSDGKASSNRTDTSSIRSRRYDQPDQQRWRLGQCARPPACEFLPQGAGFDRPGLLQGSNWNRCLGLLLLEPLLKETHAAQDWSVLAWQERNCGGGATCRARHAGLHSYTRIRALRLACLAALGFMLELFLAKENLLADAENKWLSTVNADRGFVTVFHATHFLEKERREDTSALREMTCLCV